MTIGLRLLASLIDADKGLEEYVRLHVQDDLFLSEVEQEAHQFVSKHLMTYGKLPSRETCKDSGLVMPGKQPEPPKFYFDKCRERYVFQRLKTMLKHVESDLNDDKPADALDRMVDTMTLCQVFVNRDRLVNATANMLDIVRAEYKRQYKAALTGEGQGLMLGWPTFDAMTNGLNPGDLITIVGRPGAGKTYLMLHAANTAWLNKQPPLFLSMEMKPVEIMQRVTAMLTKTPIGKLKSATLTTKQLHNMYDNLTSISTSETPYWIVDGALTASVTDAVLLARQLKPGAVFIDGAYLLRGASPKMPRWERLTENAERLKSELAGELGVPVVISYQYSRQVKKSAKPGTAGLEDIAYTDAIGQLSSVVLGLLQENEVEMLMQRDVEILKGRNGEAGKFSVRWNFNTGPNYMDFSEVDAGTGPLKFA